MAVGKFVAYYRVSTTRQGLSGLGLEAQRKAVSDYLGGDAWSMVGEFTEIESAKGADALARRPKLLAAPDLCKKKRATLNIAKLDRLARNVNFMTGLMEAGIDFKAADMPHADKVMIQIYAVMAEWERDQISKRVKAALAAAKARGVILGATGPANLRANLEARMRAADAFAQSLAPVIAQFSAAGLTRSAMLRELNRLGIEAVGGGQWKPFQLRRLLQRLQRKQMLSRAEVFEESAGTSKPQGSIT